MYVRLCQAQFVIVTERDTAKCVGMGWLRLAGSLKTQVFFAKEPYKRAYILQKRPIFLRSLLIITTPYATIDTCDDDLMFVRLLYTSTVIAEFREFRALLIQMTETSELSCWRQGPYFDRALLPCFDRALWPCFDRALLLNPILIELFCTGARLQ